MRLIVEIPDKMYNAIPKGKVDWQTCRENGFLRNWEFRIVEAVRDGKKLPDRRKKRYKLTQEDALDILINLYMEYYIKALRNKDEKRQRDALDMAITELIKRMQRER